MIVPTARCHSLPAAKYDRVAKSPFLGSRYSDLLRAGPSKNRIPKGTKSSSPVQIDPGVNPATYGKGIWSLPGKADGAWLWQSNPSSDEVKESVQLCYTVSRTVNFDIHKYKEQQSAQMLCNYYRFVITNHQFSSRMKLIKLTIIRLPSKTGSENNT